MEFYFRCNFFSFLRNFFNQVGLFPDTEILKYIPEDFVGGDLACDFAKVVEGFADVLGKQIGWEGGGESLGYPCKAF